MVGLRVVNADDLDLVMKWENNPEFWPYSATSGPFTSDEVIQFIAECQDLGKHKQCRFLITDGSQNEPLGALDLFEFDAVQKSAGIGILIAEEGNRRKGVAKSAILYLTSKEDIKRNIRLLWCIIHSDNERSLRLFESCGFKMQGETIYNGKAAVRLTRYL
ncbi:MAG: GNAT family N-acetyltransferase [Flavobacteriales bacterium]